jgi:SAM-dependent methyltransferase
VDAEPRLIEAARGAGGGLFQVGTYQSLAQLPDAQRRGADAVVCNFSLFGDASVTALFACVARLLRPGGSFIVQTLHPLEASRDAPYRDAWRQGSWDGFSSQFSDPAPWYFRTLESWTRLHADNGLVLQEMREPLHPRTGRPASVIFLSATAAS